MNGTILHRNANSPARIKLQLAIQGGGAKICALMATLQAIEDLADDIEITRIAGTSAGSIVGCMFAAGIKMNYLRGLLRTGGLGEELVRLFAMPSYFKIAKHAYSGKPFWKTKALEKKLEDLFKEQKVFCLKDLRAKGLPVIVIAADLRDARRVVIEEGTSIVNAIMDSCGLPYCFRTWKNGDGAGPLVVDGGICENLPVDVLETDLDKYGPIVPITFEPVLRSTPNTITSFSVALLDTAMNNAINRAKASVAQDHVFSIRTTISTFEFTKALKEGLESGYDDVYQQAKTWFSDYVKVQRRQLFHVAEDPWNEQNATLQTVMGTLGEVYKAQNSQNLFQYKKCDFVVQANCLLGEGELHYGDPDELFYELSFQPDKEPLYCVSVGLSQPKNARHLGKTSIQLFDSQDNELAIHHIPISNPDEQVARELLICFSPPLKPGSGTYTLRVQDQGIDLMEPLRTAGVDELSFFPRRVAGTVGQINLVLHVPVRLKDSITMSGPVGKRLLPSELVRHKTPGDFWAIGWRGDNVSRPGPEGFRVDLKIH